MSPVLRPLLARSAVVMLGLGLGPAPFACAREGASGPDGGADDSSGGDTETTGVPVDSVDAADRCEEAPLAPQGRWRGTLRGASSDVGTEGVCGGGGPDAFLRVSAPVRADLRVEARAAGFTPRLSLAPDDCQGGREIACVEGGPALMPDLAPGTVIRVSVGVDPAVFTDMNDQPAPAEGPDPLEFEVDIGFTRVLAEGEVCEPESRGRCAAGNVCERTGDGRLRVCTPLPGDTCASAELVAVALEDGVGAIEIDPRLPQTDAHRQSCTGEGQRERVLRLELPEAPPNRGLEIRASRPDVGLGLRAPGCLGADEVDCAAPAEDGAVVTIPELMPVVRAGYLPYLLVELPAESEEDPPFALELRLIATPAPWSE